MSDKMEMIDVGAWFDTILTEYKRAKKLHPVWPTDPIHAAAVVSEEAGELVRAANRFWYEGASEDEMVDEAVQVGAMAIRFLIGIGGYRGMK
ncbi:MAG TPA: hypothetical protein DCR95_11540 [Desulfobacter sp.]|nr:hypothetical protein [Desulfobacter sp.]